MANWIKIKGDCNYVSLDGRFHKQFRSGQIVLEPRHIREALLEKGWAELTDERPKNFKPEDEPKDDPAPNPFDTTPAVAPSPPPPPPAVQVQPKPKAAQGPKVQPQATKDII